VKRLAEREWEERRWNISSVVEWDVWYDIVWSSKEGE
jgi:hypothetical protein